MLWTSSVLPSPDLTVRNGSCLFLCFGWVMPAVVWIPTSTLTDWTCFDLRCLSQWILSPWWSSLRGVYCFTAYISLLFHVLTRPWERKVRVYSLLYLHTWPEDDIKPKINLLTWLTSITGRENSALLSPLHGSFLIGFCNVLFWNRRQKKADESPRTGGWDHSMLYLILPGFSLCTFLSKLRFRLFCFDSWTKSSHPSGSLSVDRRNKRQRVALSHRGASKLLNFDCEPELTDALPQAVTLSVCVTRSLNQDY